MKEGNNMEIDQDALKNFQDEGFNFVDADGNDVDYSNIADDGSFSFRHDKTVIQDQMKKADIIKTINNEFGANTNV